MSGVRVQGIPPQCPEKVVWQYFNQLSGPGAVSNVFYPVLNNDAVVIFRDDSAVAQILTCRHDRWNVLPLPNQVFCKQRVWLETGLTKLLQDEENHQDVLKQQAQLEISMDKATRQIMLTGQTYQIEWAWRYLSNLQDQQDHETCVLRSTATHGAADISDLSLHLTNGSALTNGNTVHYHHHSPRTTTSTTRSKALHSSLVYTHKSNGDASDVRSLALGGVVSSGRRLPSPAVGGGMMGQHPPQGMDPVTSLDIQFPADNGPEGAQAGGAAGGGADFMPTHSSQGTQPTNTFPRATSLQPIKAVIRDSTADYHDDYSRPSLTAMVVEDSEQTDQPTAMSSHHSQAARTFNAESRVNAYSSLPVSDVRPAHTSPSVVADAVMRSPNRTSQAMPTSERAYDGPNGSDRKKRALSQSAMGGSADLDKRIARPSSSQITAPSAYDVIDDEDYGAVGGGAGPPPALSLRPEELGEEEEDGGEPREVYGRQRAFSSMPYIASSQLKLPASNRLALLNRSIVELSRKHFNIGHRLKLKIYMDDITRTRTDAVVNAANWELKNVGGVAGALAKAAGPEMEKDCERIYRERGALKTAQVVKTKAYGKLSHLKYVLHTVGPIYRKEAPDKCVFELAQTFVNCLLFAEKLNMESVTFPFISTGIFGMPIEHCVLALFTGLHKYSYERNSGLTTLEEVHFINNDMDTVCNAVLSAEATAKRENMDSAVKRMVEGEKLYGRAVFPFCDQKDSPKKKSSKSSSSTAPSPDAQYATWDSSDPVGATAADDARSRRSQRTSRLDQLAAAASMSSLDIRSSTRPRPGSSDRNSMTGSTSSGDSQPSTSSARGGRGSSPIPRARSRSIDRGSPSSSSSGDPSPQLASARTPSSTPRTQPQIKQSLVPASATAAKKRSMGLAKSVGRGRTGDQGSGNDTDVSSAAASETEEDRQCPICLEDPMKVPRKLPCGHQFCGACADRAMAVNPRCPKCQRLFGIPNGTQPRNGTMTYDIDYTSHLPGYAACGAITITYDFPAGVQEGCHPNPGRFYDGTHRVAYLPASPEGREVLKLLQKAFEHRLVFTIGDSVTTGKSGVITWNDIHHKTSTYGGPSQFGYPDPDYLYRVKEELAAKGITHP